MQNFIHALDLDVYIFFEASARLEACSQPSAEILFLSNPHPLNQMKKIFVFHCFKYSLITDLNCSRLRQTTYLYP